MRMKDLIKISLYYLGGYHAYCSWQKPKGKRLLIIMYHDLAADSEPGSGARLKRDRPTRGQFVAHLKAIRRSYRVVSLEEAIRELREEGSLKEDSVAITFDDGYASVYEIAFPELQSYGLPATVYLSTDWINRRRELWWEQLTDMVNKADFKTVDFAVVAERLGVDVAQNLRRLASDLGSGQPFLDAIETNLRQKSDEELGESMELLKELLFKDDDYVSTPAKALTWDQIVQMSEDGMNFGSHTCSHLNLRYAESDRAEQEIAESKREIEKYLQKPVRGFAYPYGTDLTAYANWVPKLKQGNFDYAATAYPVINDDFADLFLLRRSCLPLTTSSALLAGTLLTYFAATNPEPIEMTL